ncbi:LANO_0F01002g1_1 [Lachancea nothofagi CBS 11611]|uniref:LANO_0F01002g1_1 n=1 Tax=Lachancea nothofagi CBS 11611 TaxID=1266666 RepID=A0A1G4K5V0_9SACH|nr:LANO_0F01002g1_1 [Lachancea nothofagi CBS 11611]
MDASSYFVSCALANVDDDELSVVMCQTRFSSKKCNNVHELRDLALNLTASEGSDIVAAKSVKMKSLRCFADSDPLKMWYELVKFLSGGFFEVSEIDRLWSQDGHWKFHFLTGEWKLIFEIQFEGFTQRFCELTLVSVRDEELDLFHLSLKLFKDQQEANERIHLLERKCTSLKDDIDRLNDGQTARSAMLQERDEKTRDLIVALLNEKKAMIRQLQDRLEENKGPLDIPDEMLINKYVSQPVSRMTSPRKRSAIGNSTPSPKKKARKPYLKQEKSWDDFVDQGFEIRGINREKTPNRGGINEEGSPGLQIRESPMKAGTTSSSVAQTNLLPNEILSQFESSGAGELANLELRIASKGAIDDEIKVKNGTQSTAEGLSATEDLRKRSEPLEVKTKQEISSNIFESPNPSILKSKQSDGWEASRFEGLSENDTNSKSDSETETEASTGVDAEDEMEIETETES